MFRNGLTPTHVIVVLVIVVLLFGAKRLPDVAKSVGQSLKIFKREMKDLTSADPTAVPSPPTASPTPPPGPSDPGAGSTAPGSTGGTDPLPPAGAGPQG